MITLEYADREQLKNRINKRVDRMVEMGLVDEARACFKQENRPTAAQAIGCKELFPYFRGEKTLGECVEELKLRTRQYAKRQMTWFRRDKRIIPVVVEPNDNFQQIVEKAKSIIDEKFYK